MAFRPGFELAPRAALKVGPQLRRAIALLRLSNAGIAEAAARAAFANPLLRVTGGMTDALAPAAPPGLEAHVTAEIGLLRLSEAERAIAAHFVRHLEATGWLGTGLETIVRDAGCTVEAAAAVLHRLQQIEPAGLFARTLAECLELQARERGLLDPAVTAVLGSLGVLAEGGIAALAEAAGVTTDAAWAALAALRRLDPKPGARFAVEAPGAARPPDLIATRDAKGWRLRLNADSLPTLAAADCPEDAGPAARRAAAEARAFARMVARRNATALAVARAAVARQGAFLSGRAGTPAPLRRADVAAATGLHESTVCRLAQGLSLRAPRGTIPLAALFARPLPGGGASLEAARARIAAILAAEPAGRPLDDGAIAARLAAEGIVLARRSVARHRAALGIPPRAARRRLPGR